MNRRLFFLLLLQCTASAQRYNFQSWSVEEGLVQANVYCITQDRQGYLWIGTGSGISCFDGRKFKNFTKKDGLAGNSVRSLMSDSHGRIWIGTDEGISVYDGLKFNTINRKNGLVGSTVLCLAEGAGSTVWAGTDDGGLNRISPLKTDSFVVKNFSIDNGLSHNSVFGIHIDKQERLWLATFGGINILSFKEQKPEVIQLRMGRDIPSDNILSVEPDREGNLWFGTYDAGIFKLRPSADGNSFSVITYNPSSGFQAGAVWDILFSKTGDLWAGTGEKGVARIKHEPHGREQLSFYTEAEGLSGNQVLCVFEDAEGSVWLGTNGNGLCRFGGDHFIYYSENDGLPESTVLGIDQDEEGNYWIATDGGGVTKMTLTGGKPTYQTFTSQEGLPGNFISSVVVGKAGNKNIWIATTNKGISKFDGKTFHNFSENDDLKSDRVNSIIVDDHGIVWCGTAEGISRFDGVKFQNASMEHLKMSEDGVKAVIQDKKGNIWFGTAGGLARYGGDGVLRTFDEAEGLYHKDIKCIAEDAKGNIWIGTNGGGIFFFDTHTKNTVPVKFVVDENLLNSNIINSLVFYDTNTLIAGTDKGFNKITIGTSGNVTAVKKYAFAEGFSGVECNDNAVLRDRENNIFFGTVKGLTCYKPSLEILNKLPPPVHITSIQLFYKDVNWKTKCDSLTPWFRLPQSLTLNYNENDITFNFSAVTFGNPEKIRYRFMLEGADNEWSPPMKADYQTYHKLSPGTYVFKVLACNAEGVWTKIPATFTFTIVPPWYKTSWFYISCVLLGIAAFYSWVKIRERTLREEKRVLEAKVVERTREVVQQKHEIEEKNTEIMDSINYAKGIQDAILPPGDIIKNIFPGSFVLYRPRDVVSGDFYWMETIRQGDADKSFFAAVDCTGHGVPGAFVSILGANALNRSVNEYGISEPAKILDKLTAIVEESFSKAGGRKDGMDIALCALNPATRRLEYAGANNPVYLVRAKDREALLHNGVPDTPVSENESFVLYEVKADKQPIGSFEGRKKFTNHLLACCEGDMVYVFSDGYADQFGGPKGKKFLYRQFKEVLLSIAAQPVQEQQDILEKKILDWMNGLQQVDDICVVGVRIQ